LIGGEKSEESGEVVGESS